MKCSKKHFDGIHPFDFSIKYIELYSDSPENVFDSHIHEECEIYLNLSGDISFVVENNIYPVKPGDVIITRPHEYHHCVYHSNKLHKHFWILFSSSGNEYLLDSFFNRRAGEANHLMLHPHNTDMLISLCHKMTEDGQSRVEQYCCFFELINMLQNADVVNNTNGLQSPNIVHAINYINSNFTEPISVRNIAKAANVSVNTLERHFNQALNISPLKYVRKKRLANAARLLSAGCSVTEASEQSGFPDYSNFISVFKKTYGMTPLEYKKSKQSKGT